MQEAHISTFLGTLCSPANAEAPKGHGIPLCEMAGPRRLPETVKFPLTASEQQRQCRARFLCRTSRKKSSTNALCLQEFLPRVAQEDLVQRDILRSHGCPGTIAVRTVRRHANQKALRSRKNSEPDIFVKRYGGRLLGGAGEDGRQEEADPTMRRRASQEGPTGTARFQSLPPTLMMYCLLAGLTSSVVGVDIGVSGAALQNLASMGGLGMDKEVTPLLMGWIISVAWGGNVMGTMGAYSVPNSRLLLLVSGILNGVGGLGAALAPNLNSLIVGRFICGIGSGCVNVGLSQYLAEISPASSRGGGIACLETTYIVGAVAGALLGRMWLKSKGGWRWMWGMSSPLGLIAFVAMLQLPDTPRAIFLRQMAAARRGELLIEGESGGTGGGTVVQGGDERLRAVALQQARRQAEQVMCELRSLQTPDDELLAELDDMEEFYGAGGAPGASPSSASSGAPREVVGEMKFLDIMKSGVHRKVLAQASLALITPALTGHAAVMTYGPQIFDSIGYSMSQGADFAVVFQTVKLLVTLPDFLWLDVVPRKMLMNIGLAGMAGSYVVAIVALPLHLPSVTALALLSSAAFYQSSVGPLSWIMPTEVLSAELRSRGSAITSTMYAGAGLTLVMLHPLMAQHGPMTPFIVYTGCTTVALALNKMYLPETMGLSLEAIEREAFREETESPEPVTPA